MDNLMDWAILAALAVTATALWRLGRSLRASKRLHNALKDDLQAFMTASEKTQTALNVLEEARKEITRSVDKDRRESNALKEDLLYLTEQGKIVADRLENSLHGLRSATAAKTAADRDKSTPAKPLQKSLDKLR